MPIAADQPPLWWRSPVAPVAIVRPYRAVPRFAAGGHRGIDLRAEPGEAVVAPCAGRITFRGAVAGGPPTVTIDCGRLRATLQRVAPSAALGSDVARGATVGQATATALDLSAREADGAYVDPTSLLGARQGSRVPVVGARPARRKRPRPPLTGQDAYRPARIADRALVTPRGAPGAVAGASPGRAAVDVPLGVAGGALMALVGVAWGLSAARMQRRARSAARGTSLARVQR